MNAVEHTLSRLQGVRRSGDGYIGRCPAHEDRSPSLSIREGRDGVLLHCFAGCSVPEIVAALGLRMADLFDQHQIQAPVARPQRPPTADEIESALHAHLQRIRAEEAAKIGYEPPITSELINAARRAVSRIFGIVLPPVPPTRAEMHEILAGVRRAIAGRSSLFSVAGAPGLAYVRTRKLNVNAAYDADVKYHPNWLGCGPAVIFAVRDQRGSIVGAQGRFLDPLAEPKTLSRGSIKIGAFQTPGALDADVIAITEAPLDAISLALWGLPSLAIMGASNYAKPWFWPRQKTARIIIATDADAAGEKAASELRQELGAARCERFMFPADINDANEFLQRDPAGLAAYVQALLLNNNAESALVPASSSVISLDAHRLNRDAHPSPPYQPIGIHTSEVGA